MLLTMKLRERISKTRAIRIAIAIGLAVMFVYIITFLYIKNPAETVADPIRESMVANGANLKCSGGGSGIGPDDYTPGYAAYFETSLKRQQAEELISKVTKDSGFNVKQAQAGQIPVDDRYIHNWYIDHTNKKSSYPFLKSGPIELTFNIYDDGQYVNCPRAIIYKEPSLRNDTEHAVMVLQTQLPERKPTSLYEYILTSIVFVLALSIWAYLWRP